MRNMRVGLFLLMFCAVVVNGATNYWAPGNVLSASGTWDVGTTANWSANADGSGTLSTWTDGDRAVFNSGGVAMAVTISGVVAPSGITYASKLTTISGGIISNEADNLEFFYSTSLRFDTTITINSQISGTGTWRFATTMNDVNKAGTVLFNLTNNSNDRDGNITIQSIIGASGGGYITRLGYSANEQLGNINNMVTLLSGGSKYAVLEARADMNLERVVKFDPVGGYIGASSGNALTVASTNYFDISARVGISGAGQTILTYSERTDSEGWHIKETFGGLKGDLVVSNANQLGTGLITVQGGTLTVIEDMTINNTITFLAGVNDIDVADGKILIANNVTDTGDNKVLHKNGAGTLNIADPNGFPGLAIFNINEGILLVSNTSVSGTGEAEVTVKASAVLGGTGIIMPEERSGVYRGVTLQASSTLAPGASTGTLTFNLTKTTKGVTFDSDALLEFELNTVIDSDKVDIIDDAVLVDVGSDVVFNSNMINFTDISSEGLQSGSYTLFTFDADSSYTGTMSIGTGLENYEASLIYNADSIVLELLAGAAGTILLIN